MAEAARTGNAATYSDSSVSKVRWLPISLRNHFRFWPRRVISGRAEVSANSERRPLRGAVAIHVTPGYQACTLSLSVSSGLTA